MQKEIADSGESAYLYTVGWSADNEVCIGRVVEFSSLAAHGDMPQAVLDEIMNVVRIVLENLHESGEDVPATFIGRAYSGNLNLRKPPALHLRLSVGGHGKVCRSIILSTPSCIPAVIA